MGRLSILLLVTCIFIGFQFAQSADIFDEIRTMEIFRIRDGSAACPVILVGQACPESNSLYYFKCCGELANSCCFRLQDWAIAIIAIFIVLTVIGMFVNLLRCICGC